MKQHFGKLPDGQEASLYTINGSIPLHRLARPITLKPDTSSNKTLGRTAVRPISLSRLP